MNSEHRDMGELFRDDELILEAMRQAYRAAVRQHRASGVPMVFWEDGKVIEVPADQLECDEPAPPKPNGR